MLGFPSAHNEEVAAVRLHKEFKREWWILGRKGELVPKTELEVEKQSVGKSCSYLWNGLLMFPLIAKRNEEVERSMLLSRQLSCC